MREGYKTKSSSKKSSKKSHWVKPECIKSQTGKSDKGEKLIVLMEKDVLKKYGYDNIKLLSKTARQIALKKAIKENKALSVYRRIIAIATLNKNKNPELYKILRDDALWIKSQIEYISKQSSKK